MMSNNLTNLKNPFKNGIRYFVLPNYKELDPDYKPPRVEQKSYNEVREEAGKQRRGVVMRVINEHPEGITRADLANILGWGLDKTASALHALLGQKKIKREVRTSRSVNEEQPRRWSYFLYKPVKVHNAEPDNRAVNASASRAG